jgi:hypothetical protein
VFDDGLPREREVGGKLGRGLRAVVDEELEDLPPGRIGHRREELVERVPTRAHA